MYLSLMPYVLFLKGQLFLIYMYFTDIRNFTRFLTAGQNYSYWCEYKTAPIKFKFICKGDDPSICQPLTTTMKTINTNKFYMKDDLVKNITINVTDVTTDDTGTYWCGSESTDPSRNRTFYHMFLMIVGRWSNYFCIFLTLAQIVTD